MERILTVCSTHYFVCILGIVALCVKYVRTRESLRENLFRRILRETLPYFEHIEGTLPSFPARKCRILEAPLFFLPRSPDRAVGNLFLAGGVCGIIQNPGVSPRTCRSLRRNAKSVVGGTIFLRISQRTFVANLT